MPFVSIELFSRAAKELADASPLLLVTIPAMMKLGVAPANDDRDANEKETSGSGVGGADERSLLEAHFTFPGATEVSPFWLPTGGWVKKKYPGSSLQRQRKDRARDLFIQGDLKRFFPRGATWESWLADKALHEFTSPISILFLGAVVLQDQEVESFDDIVAQTRDLFQIPSDLVPRLYDDTVPAGLPGLSPERMTDADLQSVLGLPSDFFGQTKSRVSVSPEMSNETSTLIQLLLRFQNLLLEGPPGTGKTHVVDDIRSQWESKTGRKVGSPDSEVMTITMHPSTTYEDFVEGLKFSDDNDGFIRVDGFISRWVTHAMDNPDLDYIVLLDELNRCNVPKVIGDMLPLLEKSKRCMFSNGEWMGGLEVALPYSGKGLRLPGNLFIVATSNTADLSVAPIDAAVRRRFGMAKLLPLDESELESALGKARGQQFVEDNYESISLLTRLNHDFLRPLAGATGMIGHSYLFDIAGTEDEPGTTWRYAILPQLVDIAEAHGLGDLLATRWHRDDERPPDLTAEGASAVQALQEFLATLTPSLELQTIGLGASKRLTLVARQERPAEASTRESDVVSTTSDSN